MKHLNKWGREHLLVSDLVAVVIVAVALKLTSEWLKWEGLLTKDGFSITAGILSLLSIGTYLSLVYVNKPKLPRLRNSAQFKKILLITAGYFLLTILAYILQMVTLNFGLVYLAISFVAVYRIVWFNIKTLSLF